MKEFQDKLEGIAKKLREIPKQDYYNHQIKLTDEENSIIDALRPIVIYLMYDEIKLLNNKIKNHHHIVLSVEKGMEYRDNGMNITPFNIGVNQPE